MKKLFLLILILHSLAAESQPYNFSTVDNLLNANLNAVFHNKVVCMVMRNDSLIYYYHQGADSLTTGLIASCSKTFSGALMLRLVQEGTINLDDSIAKYYPFTSAIGKGGMTLRNLFAHTSGLSGTTDYNTSTNINLQQSADSILRNDMLTYPPIGTKFRYTGEDQQVAGAAAELATGIQWDSLFRRKLGQPLHLDSTRFQLTTQVNPRIAGGIKTNSVDMLRFAKFILQNGKNNQGLQVVDSTLMQELWKDQTNHAIQISSPYPNSPTNNNPYNKDTIYYGFGTWLDIYNPTHQYQEQISADGAFGGIVWINRCTNMVGTFLTFAPSNYSTTYPVEYQAMDIFRNAVPFNCYTVLSVNFRNFRGEINDNQNKLSWLTDTEINSAGFEVQHSSDGNIFFTIALLPSNAVNGVSNARLMYEYTDPNPGTTNFYRLKHIDKDGKFTYSNVLLLNNANAKNLLTVYPNPAKQFFIVDFAKNVFDMVISDIAGRKIYEKNKIMFNAKIFCNQFDNGVYFVRATCSSKSFTQKLIIQK